MIATERLLLDVWRDDYRAPAAAMNADPAVMHWFPAPLTVAETDAQIDRQIATLAQRGFCFWPVIRRADGVFLGLAGLKDGAPATPIEGSVEIGWRFAAHAWGHGYATEAARAALAHAFADPHVPEVAAITAAGNAPSWRVMERLGMTRDPVGEFDHPSVAVDHHANPHVTYRIARP